MTSKTPLMGRRTGPVALTIGTAAIGLAALLTTAVFKTQAISAEPSHAVKPQLSEATKARLKKGHWTGGAAGMSWQAGADKSYKSSPPLSEATKARMQNGHWTGGAAGMSWQAGQDKSYNPSPELSEATKTKMRKGHWEGGAAGMWWVPGPDSK